LKSSFAGNKTFALLIVKNLLLLNKYGILPVHTNPPTLNKPVEPFACRLDVDTAPKSKAAQVSIVKFGRGESVLEQDKIRKHTQLTASNTGCYKPVVYAYKVTWCIVCFHK